MFFYTRPCKARKPRNATLAASSLSTPGGSEAEIAGDEEEKVHLCLDDILSRLQADIAAEQKKHIDRMAAFEKKGKDAQKAKEEMDAAKSKLTLASLTFNMAKHALDKAAKRYKVQADEKTDAEALATDDSWQTDVQALQSSITGISTLREAVENLSDEYVHSTENLSGTAASPAVDFVAAKAKLDSAKKAAKAKLDSAKKARDDATKATESANQAVQEAAWEVANKKVPADNAEKAVNEVAQKIQDLTKSVADAEGLAGGDLVDTFLSTLGLGGATTSKQLQIKELEALKTLPVPLEASRDIASNKLKAAESAKVEAKEKLEEAVKAEVEAKLEVSEAEAQLIAVPTVGGAPSGTVLPEMTTMAPSATTE